MKWLVIEETFFNCTCVYFLISKNDNVLMNKDESGTCF